MDSEASETAIRREYERLWATGSYTKRSSVRLALANVIHSGDLRPGTVVPPEQRLTDLLGVSLGTVQVALRQLSDRGLITRRRGDGTRVSERQSLPDSTWHVRFVDVTTYEPLLIRDEHIWLDTVAEDGPWRQEMGAQTGASMLRRTFVYNNGARVAQEIYLSKPAMKVVDTIGISELEFTNIRPVLLRHVADGGEIVRRHRVIMRAPSAYTAELHDLPRNESYVELHAIVSMRDDAVFYFQRIYFPAAKCALEL